MRKTSRSSGVGGGIAIGNIGRAAVCAPAISSTAHESARPMRMPDVDRSPAFMEWLVSGKTPWTGLIVKPAARYGRYIRSTVSIPRSPSPVASVRAVRSHSTSRPSRTSGSAWSTGHAS